MRRALKKAIKQFLETTTLHGFKYLCSPFYADRIGWVFCCLASACCAGMLCTILWARFLSAPTLLSLLEQRHQGDIWFPSVGVCITPSRFAQLFEQKISVDEQIKVSLPTLFSSLHREKILSKIQIAFLEHVLARHDMSLAELLMNITEPCHSILRLCRVMGRTMPCDQLFHKQVSPLGVCCVATADTLDAASKGGLVINPRMGLVLQCSSHNDSIPNSCEFFTRFPYEEWVPHVDLTTGYIYSVPLVFTAIKDSSKEKLVDGTCVSRTGYSRRKCLIKCKELKCGCSDPLTTNQAELTLPLCSLNRMNCLRRFELIEASCTCPASCRKLFTQTMMESSRINELTFDPVFATANASSIIVDIQVLHGASKTFDLMYTQTWWSLLSSLGGLFNMFLGVGLFSALEVVFLLAERLPVTFYRSSQLSQPPSHSNQRRTMNTEHRIRRLN